MRIANLDRRHPWPSIALAALIWFTVAHAAAQSPAVSIVGAQPNTVQLTVDALKQLTVQRIRVVLENGTEAEFEGVAVSAILTKTGVAMGTAIRGKRLADYLLVTARDGYRAIFALPELDPAFTDRTVLLCFAQDGRPLPAEDGPFRLIVPGEKRHARGVRQVDRLTLKTEM